MSPLTDSAALRPRLRPIRAEATHVDGRAMVVLRDQNGLTPAALVIPPELIDALQLFDGQRTLTEICAAVPDGQQRLEMLGVLSQLASKLDQCLLLDSPAFARHLEKLREEYAASEVRPLRNPETYGPTSERQATIAAILCQPEPLDLRSPESVGLVPQPEGRVLGVIAPHLDYARGFRCYRDAYTVLPPPDGRRRRVVVLGTNHAGRAPGVIATDKAFQTFSGAVPTDKAFLDRLDDLLHAQLRQGQFDHLAEHSIELHAVLLAEKYGPENVVLVPILCHDPCQPPEAAGPTVSSLAKALAELIAADPDTPTLILSSADFSHMGQFFEPDDPPVGNDLLADMRHADEAVFELMEDGDISGLIAHVARCGNATRMCSIGNVATALLTVRALDREARAIQLSYHQAVLPDAQSAVSCSAWVLLGRDGL